MKIIICTQCGGCGNVEFDVGTHKSEYEQEVCGKCEGSGRMEQKLGAVIEIPFIPGKQCKRLY